MTEEVVYESEVISAAKNLEQTEPRLKVGGALGKAASAIKPRSAITIAEQAKSSGDTPSIGDVCAPKPKEDFFFARKFWKKVVDEGWLTKERTTSEKDEQLAESLPDEEEIVVPQRVIETAPASLWGVEVDADAPLNEESWQVYEGTAQQRRPTRCRRTTTRRYSHGMGSNTYAEHEADLLKCRYCNEPYPTHSPADCPQKRCSRCRMRGHPTRKCPNGVPIQCLLCYGFGHVSRECETALLKAGAGDSHAWARVDEGGVSSSSLKTETTLQASLPPYQPFVPSLRSQKAEESARNASSAASIPHAPISFVSSTTSLITPKDANNNTGRAKGQQMSGGGESMQLNNSQADVPVVVTYSQSGRQQWFTVSMDHMPFGNGAIDSVATRQSMPVDPTKPINVSYFTDGTCQSLVLSIRPMFGQGSN